MRHMKTVMSILLLMVGFFTMEAMAHGWMAPKKAANVKNPVALNDKSVERGKEVYSQNCAACHGNNIEGLEAEAAGLEMSPPNLKKRLRTHSDGDFFWKIKEGRGDMPSFNDDLSDSQIWQTINYIRSEVE
jgi:mono/diheme cytochrome c family protein